MGHQGAATAQFVPGELLTHTSVTDKGVGLK